MNKQEFAKVVQAWAEGETIQWRPVDTYGWSDIHDCYPMNWNLTRLDYRIKPKDKIEYFYYASDRTRCHMSASDLADLRLTYTNGKLTNAEVLK